MAACSVCGAELSGSPRFCPECGARVAVEDVVPREVRKTVTVLFCDLAGSTALGEQLDPEQLRAVMGRYFAVMQAIIERHGGTVEKFIGDAIMAVFGIPTLHEDDALRAVRAAGEMQEALTALNAELAAEGGPRIQTRTGINTGEVVTSDASTTTLVTGDAVNTAARLEQAADVGEILLGAATVSMVRDAVTVESVPPISARGKSHPVSAFRLVSVVAGAEGHTRRFDAPLLGRERELRLLSQVWDRVVEERASQLFTILGSAGVGKSRLASEFLGSIQNGIVLRGRCLPYGEGITYWPLAEVLRGAAGIDEADGAEAARAKLNSLVAGERDAAVLAARLADAIGLSSSGAAQEELFWAVRRALEWIARERPLVVVWDDIQWAEPTFLDLVEHLADWSRDAPLLILAMARPELLDLRAGWGGGKLNATTILLEPLQREAAYDLIGALPGGEALPDSLRRRISEAAEGNPLFVEEMLAMMVDEGRLHQVNGGWVATDDLRRVPVPPTIAALLAARLDRLAPGERSVAERAAVVGRIFERGAVTELSPESERSEVAGRLLALIRKELVRPQSEPGLAGDDAFRFRHLLIRDAAYAALPKTERSFLHEGFAAWLERAVGDRIGEYGEVIAHHLEQAYRYRVELGDASSATEEIGRRAAVYLAESSRRALARGDLPASIALGGAAISLPVTDEQHVEIGVRLARCQVDVAAREEAKLTLDKAGAAAVRLGSEAGMQQVVVGRAFLSMESESVPDYTGIERIAREAIANFEASGDAVGLARSYDLLAQSSFYANRITIAGPAWRSAAEWAARSGDHGEEARILPLLPATATYAEEATTREAIDYCRALVAAHPDSPMLRARAQVIMAWQHAERGEFEDALALREASRSASNELGLLWLLVENGWIYADIDLLRGDPAAAEREARAGIELAELRGYRMMGMGLDAMLSALTRQGRVDEAREWMERVERSLGGLDPYVQIQLNLWRATFAARDGDDARARWLLAQFDGAELMADDAARMLIQSAEVFDNLDLLPDAMATLEKVLAICERKEMSVRASHARRMIETIRSRTA